MLGRFNLRDQAAPMELQPITSFGVKRNRSPDHYLRCSGNQSPIRLPLARR
jgi:hypothetical protein